MPFKTDIKFLSIANLIFQEYIENEKKMLISYLNNHCHTLFYYVKNFLIKNETDNLRIITGDDSTTIDNYPYPYDKDDVLEFSHGRCQDSSKITGKLLLKSCDGFYDKEANRFVIIVEDKKYYIDYMVYGKNEHAFLKITSIEYEQIQVIIDASYKQFAAILNLTGIDTFFADCKENGKLKKISSVYVGSVDHITSYFRKQLPKTHRKPKDCAKILKFWTKGKAVNATLIALKENVIAYKGKKKMPPNNDQTVLYLADIV